MGCALTGFDAKAAVVTGAGRMRSIGRPIALGRRAGWRDIDSAAEEAERRSSLRSGAADTDGRPAAPGSAMPHLKNDSIGDQGVLQTPGRHHSAIVSTCTALTGRCRSAAVRTLSHALAAPQTPMIAMPSQPQASGTTPNAM